MAVREVRTCDVYPKLERGVKPVNVVVKTIDHENGTEVTINLNETRDLSPRGLRRLMRFINEYGLKPPIARKQKRKRSPLTCYLCSAGLVDGKCPEGHIQTV